MQSQVQAGNVHILYFRRLHFTELKITKIKTNHEKEYGKINIPCL